MDRLTELMLLDHNQIPYEQLDDQTLIELASQSENLFITTFALSALHTRLPQQAGIIAWRQLTEKAGDDYLRAQALAIVYETDLKRSIAFMSEHQHTDNLYLLETMIETIDFDTADANPPLTQLAKVLAQRARQLGPASFEWAEGVENFIQHFRP